MFGIDYVLIGLAVYLLVAIGHFIYFTRGIAEATGGQYVLLALAGLFWPVAHIGYWIHLIRTR